MTRLKKLSIGVLTGVILTTTIVMAFDDPIQEARNKDAENWATLQSTQFQLRQLQNKEKEALINYCKSNAETSRLLLEESEETTTPEQREAWKNRKDRNCANYYVDSLTKVYTGPSSLFYTFLKGDGAYVTQSLKNHLYRNSYAAIDIGTGNKHLEVRAPSYMKSETEDLEKEYTVHLVDYPKTTGKTMILTFEDEGIEMSFLLGHIKTYLKQDGDIVHTGDVVAISGGDPLDDDQGATTGLHLHFEFHIADIGAMPYPAYLYTKHTTDQVDNIEVFLKKYGADNVKGETALFRKVGADYGIKPEVLVAIANADSSLGRALKTKNNIGNVGNTSDGRTQEFETLELAVEAMAKTLNNEYLKDKTTIGELSVGGGGTGHIYASSDESWNKNVLASLRKLYDDNTIDESFNFRIND